jgi:hypothetical protein
VAVSRGSSYPIQVGPGGFVTVTWDV